MDSDAGWRDLRLALCDLYDQCGWVKRGTLVDRGSTGAHTCSPSCRFVSHSVVYVCMASGHVHLCTETHCDRCVHERERIFCTLTGNDFEHEEGLVYGYNNADATNYEYVNRSQARAELLAHEATLLASPLHPPPLHAPTAPANPRRRRRKQHHLIAPDSVAPAAAAATAAVPSLPPPPPAELPSWASVTHNGKKKRHYASISESINADAASVHGLAVTFLDRLGVTDGRVRREAARACVDAWSYVSSAPSFHGARYDMACHVSIVLRSMQTRGVCVAGGVQLIPHEPSLSAFIDSPKDFFRPPYNVSQQAFTRCSNIFRVCICERIEQG